MTDSRSVAFPTPRTRPDDSHPAMEHRYTKPDSPISYLDLTGVEPGQVVSGTVIDDADANGYRRGMIIVQMECDNVPHPATVYLHVLSSLDGSNFSDPNGNTGEFEITLYPRSDTDPAAFYVFDSVPAPPMPFKLAIEYWTMPDSMSEALGAFGLSYAFYSLVEVPA